MWKVPSWQAIEKYLNTHVARFICRSPWTEELRRYIAKENARRALSFQCKLVKGMWVKLYCARNPSCYSCGLVVQADHNGVVLEDLPYVHHYSTIKDIEITAYQGKPWNAATAKEAYGSDVDTTDSDSDSDIEY